MSTILGFLLGPNGLFAVLLAAILGATVWMRRDARKDERNAQAAKEAKARAKNLEDVKRAQDAARAVHPDDGRMQSDPNNRDNG